MVKKIGIIKILIAVSALLLVSCKAYKNIPYTIDADKLTPEQLDSAAYLYEATIKPTDVLSITVNTVTPGVAKDFNLPLIPQNMKSVTQTASQYTTSESGSLQSYVVDKEGYVTMPIIGRVKIGGLTKAQAEQYISSRIYPEFLKEVPLINIRFLTFRVIVNGEVVRPGIYEATNEQMTIFEALAAAGDLTIFGKRDNVKLFRTLENGRLKVYNINLQDKNILLDKDIYYLQQNDRLYVEANKARGNSSSWGTVESVTLSSGLSAISILISVISIITR